jgi:hypothetical protein
MISKTIPKISVGKTQGSTLSSTRKEIWFILDAYGKDLTLPKRLFQDLKRHSYLASLISERLFLLRNELRRTQFEANALDTGRAEGK